MRHILAWSLSAHPRTWKNFGRIRKLQWIESAADALHRLQVRLGEHLRHHVLLLFADPVLAGNRPALLDAQFEYALGQSLGGFFLARNAAIVENQRMQIPVSS